jgi:hypothetical protein
MDALIQKTGNVKYAKNFCESLGKQYGGPSYAACYHGIGHGITNRQKPVALESDISIIQSSLKICESVNSDSVPLGYCASGVFGGFFDLFNQNRSLYLSQDTGILSVCELQEDRFKEQCYHSVGNLLLRTVDNNLQKSVAVIENIKDKKYAKIAMVETGANITKVQTNDNKFSTDINFCLNLNEFSDDCLDGLLIGVIDGGEPGKEYINAIAFCKNTLLSTELRTSCKNNLIDALRSLYLPDKYEKIKPLITKSI